MRSVHGKVIQLALVVLTISLSACSLTYKHFRPPKSNRPIIVHDRFEVSVWARNFPWRRRDISNFYLTIHTDVYDSTLSCTAREPDSVVQVNTIFFRTDCMTEPIQLGHRPSESPRRRRPYSMSYNFAKQHIDNNCTKIYLSFDAILYSYKKRQSLESVPVEMVIERHHMKVSPMY